jgi:hypothetical protein
MSQGIPGENGKGAPVIDLAEVRHERRRDELLAGLARAQDGNRAAVARLVHSKLLWTRRGARAGRQLLTNWERLVEETERLKRLTPLEAADRSLAEPLFDAVETLLAKSARLANRSAEIVAQSR